MSPSVTSYSPSPIAMCRIVPFASIRYSAGQAWLWKLSQIE